MARSSGAGARRQERRPAPDDRGGLRRRVVIAAIPAVVLGVILLIWLRPSAPDEVAVTPAASVRDEPPAVPSAADAPPAASGTGAPPLPELSAPESPLAQRIRTLRQKVQQQPASADAWGMLGGVFDAHDFRDEATVCYKRAKELNPVDFRWPYFLGYLHELDDQETALENFLHAAQVNPDYPPVHVNVGRGFLFAEDLERAEEHLARAIELDPSLVRAWLDRAQVALTAGDVERAMEYLEHALELEPASGEPYLLLSGAYQRLGRFEEAQRALTLGQEQGKREPLPDSFRNSWLWSHGVTLRWHRTRGDQLLAAGRIEDAVADWRRAVERYPDESEAHGQLGLALVRAGKIDEAVASLRRALTLDPEAHKVRKFLGGVLIQTGRTREGLDHLRQAAAGLVDEPQEQFEIASTFRHLQFFDEALAIVERALTSTPEDARLLGLQGRLLLDRGATSEAIASLEASVEAHPDDPQRHLDLAEAYERAGLHLELIETLRRGRELHPGHDGLARTLAWHLATSPDPLFRDAAEAVEIMAPRCEAAGFTDPAQLDVLAAAHAEQGNFEAATRIAQMALYRLSFPEGEAGGKQQITDFDLLRAEERLELYRQGVPYIQTP